MKSLAADGIDGHVLDFEAPYEKPGAADALGRLFDHLDRDLPGLFLADAPHAFLEWHRAYPHDVARGRLSARVDGPGSARMPQSYWTENFHGLYSDQVTKVDVWWAADFEKHGGPPIRHIGCTYGSEWPSKPPGPFKAEDLDAFLDSHGPDCSLYSLDAMGPVCRAVLERRAAERGRCADHEHPIIPADMPIAPDEYERKG